MSNRIGIDIGGTFTDVVLLQDSGRFLIYKEDSTPDEPLRAITRGLAGVAREIGSSVEDLLLATDVLVHGQTMATNALIERTGPTIGLLCTAGFRDVIHIGKGGKPERFNVHLPKPADFVPRYLRLGIPERIAADGSLVKPLDEDAVRAAARELGRHGVKAIAIAYLWSVADNRHERRSAEIVREELPGVDVVCSSDILPEIREWERTSATVLSAYIAPMISEYLASFETEMRERRLPHRPLIMQVNGGCAAVPELLARPVNAIASGPAAGPAAGAYYASNTKAPGRLIVVDMGGTSFDVCLLRDGEPVMSTAIKVADQPIGVNGVEVLSVGAGGGSIAWIDSGRSLRVGPRSAGSQPGPACYGRGGREPTVTDANLATGRMSSNAFLGGRRALDATRASIAIRQYVAEPLGLDVDTAAAGIITIVNANMAMAIRAVSIERGIDPRDYVMVAGGGAGGLHAAELARMLGIAEVLVPRSAGGLCAFGMAVTPVRHDYVRLLHGHTNAPRYPGGITAVFDDMQAEATRQLEADGFAREEMRFVRHVEGRYPGQVHNLTVQLPPGPIDAALLRALEAVFHDEHERRFTYAMRDQPVECLHWRLAATGNRPAPRGRLGREGGGTAKPGARRPAYMATVNTQVLTDVYDGETLAAGDRLNGPAIVEFPTTTVVVNPGDTLTVQADGSSLLGIGAVTH
ncbi:MAG: hydantoinase/oxoprolinase family protein [Gammaproteobacteria bacterium]|nr:hydantoinase/oxoprolinase family protein [Gammaproteobacteria bacterium]MBI5616652.1 hydantoinase/oxoprolinase family protein [Gammaproteobacteria bacterium]